MNTRHVGAPGHAGQPRAPALTRRRDRRPCERRSRRGRGRRSAGWPSQSRSPPAPRRSCVRSRVTRRPARRRDGGGHARADRLGAFHRQPLLRPHGRRARGRRPAAAAPASRCSPPISRVPAPAGVEVVETPTAADLEREALARAGADVFLMAAAVADYRAADADRRQAARRTATPWQLELTPTTDIARALGASRSVPSQVLVAFGAEHGAEGLERKRAMLRRQERRSRRLQRRGTQRHRLRQRRQRGHADHARPATGSCRGRRSRSIAAAVLDEVERLIEGR